MQTWQVILIIAIVFGFVWGNIALLKSSAKYDMTQFNKDPIEKAKASLAEKQQAQANQTENEDKKNEHL